MLTPLLLSQFIFSGSISFSQTVSEQLKKSAFQNKGSKTNLSFMGIKTEIGYSLFPELLACAALNLSFNSKFTTLRTAGADVTAKYYLLGDTGTTVAVKSAPLSLGKLSSEMRYWHDAEPIWSAYLQGGFTLQKFDISNSQATANKIVLEEEIAPETKGTYFGMVASLGGEYLVAPLTRLGISGNYRMAMAGLDNLKLNEFYGLLSASYRFR
jgi:hypothetical protein